MAAVFDERVEYAIRYLWMDTHSRNGEEAKKKLEEAAAAGNADAYYFLGRCYLGQGFISPEFGFPEDDSLGESYITKSIELGSAVAMFAGMRLGGYKPPKGTYVHPPYHSIKEIWDEVNRMADAGSAFCLMLVANAYYYGDVAYFLHILPGMSHSTEEYRQYEHDWALKAAELYDKCLSLGMYLCIGNYIHILTSGDNGIPKQPGRARQLEQLGAGKGIDFCEYRVGVNLFEEKQAAQAEQMFQRAVSHGNKSSYYYLGELYTFRGMLRRDLYKAKEYYEAALAAGKEETACHNSLGEIYFYGGDGVAVDYDKAFYHLYAAYRADNRWGAGMLGTCCLKGLGTGVDYQKAWEIFHSNETDKLSLIGIGEMYAYGLGVKTDIRSAMVYWSNYPEDERVIANKQNFRHTLFGWKRKE